VNESPLKSLAVLTEEFKKFPSEGNHYLIQDAITRITAAGELDAESKKAVAETVNVLTTVKLP